MAAASTSGNKLKQNLPAKGLLQRGIGTMLKVWTQTEKLTRSN